MSAFRTAISAVILSSAVILPAAGPSAQTGISATPWTELHASRVRLVAGRAKSAKGHYLRRPRNRHGRRLEDLLAHAWRFRRAAHVRLGRIGQRRVDQGSLSRADAHARSGRRGDRLQAVGAAAHRDHAAGRLPSPSSSSWRWNSAFAARSASRRRRTSISRSLPLPPVRPRPEIAAAIERVPRPQQEPAQGRPRAQARQRSAATGPRRSSTIEASFAGDATGADVFIEAPEGLYVPMPKRVAADAGRRCPVRD